ncbi:MAG: MFS transporter [Gammaproteobacteria bacterium]|nr:MFS transporter [Gammaproteobacteria bacterium]
MTAAGTSVELNGPERLHAATAPSALDGWTGIQLTVVGLCFVVNMIDGMDVLLMSYIAPTLQEEWAIGADELGVVFSISVLGMAIGGIGLAPLADFLGRRRLCLAALATSTFAMLASGFVVNVPQLMALRFLVGVGVGTVLASMAALVAEYAPPRYRNFAVGLLYAGYPLGAIFTGLVSARTIPSFGWQATLVGAGCISAAMLVALWAMLPESMQFLIKRRPRDALERFNAILARLDRPAVSELPRPDEAPTKAGVAGLFAEGRTASTVLLWLSMIFGYAALWFTMSWIPQLAVIAGLDSTDAIYAGTTFNAGAFVGTVTLGLITARLRLQPTILAFLVVGAVVMVIFGFFRFGLPLTLMIAFAIGFLQMGGFNGVYPLATQLYPAEVRSTGVGWTMGVGRIGAFLGPLIGGVLIEANLGLGIIFLVFAVPTALGAVCAYLVRIERAPAG